MLVKVFEKSDIDRKNILNNPSGKRGRVLALGYFDGVHRGHGAILQKTVEEALKRGELPAVHTFSSPPVSKSCFRDKKDGKETVSALLTTQEEKNSLFKAAGIEEELVFPFYEKLMNLAPADFLDHCVKHLLEANVVVAGEDYRFGKDRAGDAAFLQAWGKKEGVEVFIVSPVAQKGKIVSSTRIRTCIQTGRIEEANDLLGYPLSYMGEVELGFQIGRTLQFPTANTRIEQGKVIPAYGVYASIFYVDGTFLSGISNIGLRPTLKRNEQIPTIETMVYGKDFNIYGKKVRVFLLSFTRPEACFSSLEDLKSQVHKDIKSVENYHLAHPFDYSILYANVLS